MVADEPSKKTMMDRTKNYKEMVYEALKFYPPCRGDDLLLYIHVLRRHYYKLVQVGRTKEGGLKIEFYRWDNVLLVPSFESLRRRRQEWFEIERERLERGEILKSDILPTERVQRKRKRLEEGYRDYYKGQKELRDWGG